MCTAIKNTIARLHRDDEGTETLQVVMVAAIAVMVCIGVMKVTGITVDGGESGGLFRALTGLVQTFLPSWTMGSLGGGK